MSFHPKIVPYLSLADRPEIIWPGNARIAVWVAVNIEHWEYLPSPTEQLDSWPRVPHPDVQQYAFHDYSNRVGLWRFLEVTDALDIPLTTSLNMGVLDRYPEVARAIRDRRMAVMAHGIYNTQHLFGLEEDQEREFYRVSLSKAESFFGPGAVRGMLGPAVTASERTPRLMSEAGLTYHADWILDDQPAPLDVGSRPFVSIPYTFELNDGPLIRSHFEGPEWAELCIDQFDQLYSEGGRVMCLALHPFRIAQPHRIKYLRRVLEHMKQHTDVWFTNSDAIVEFFIANYYQQFVMAADRRYQEGSSAREA